MEVTEAVFLVEKPNSSALDNLTLTSSDLVNFSGRILVLDYQKGRECLQALNRLQH